VKLNDPTVIAEKRVSSTLEAYAITRSKADGENGGESTGAVQSSARG
jgi:hypothetical protein